MQTTTLKLRLIVAVLFLSGLACSLIPSLDQEADAAPTTDTQPAAAPTSLPPFGGFANPAIPFEGVVQIWAAYYDSLGDLQIGWTGSGTIISPDGYILTNAHVVLPDRYFPVDELIVAMTLSQDDEPTPSYFAEVLQADADLDIAVIRVSTDYDGNPVDFAALSLPYVPLGDSDGLNLGDDITILGYPGIGGETVTLTSGKVSGFTSDPQYGARAFIKTSATIAGGNSGGLAADSQGNIVGIPTQLGYGGDDQFVDCRVLVDTNRDGFVDDNDDCVPTGGFINALRPIGLALPLIVAAQSGQVAIDEGGPSQAAAPRGSSFSDDFSDPNSGWDIYAEDSGSAYYENGEYYLEDVAGDIYYSALANVSFEDVEFSVDFRFVQGESAEVDPSCRYVDPENGYEFRVANDGYVGISMWLDGEYLDLVEPYDSGLSLGSGTHRLTVNCTGSQLSMSIDGQPVAETTDDTFAIGDLALAIYNYEDSGTAIAAFDNFEAEAAGGQLGGSEGSGEILFFDDFSNPESSWEPRPDDPEFPRRFESGSYVLEVPLANGNNGDYVELAFGDVAMSVDVTLEQRAGDGEIGLLCRFVDADNFYGLSVSEDGYYSIWRFLDGEYTDLIPWTHSSLIPTNGVGFTLNAVCDGSQLAVGIDGQMLDYTVATDFASGYVGMVAYTYEDAPLVVAFDNFTVAQP